jgi:hypothetical protein
MCPRRQVVGRVEQPMLEPQRCQDVVLSQQKLVRRLRANILFNEPLNGAAFRGYICQSAPIDVFENGLRPRWGRRCHS